MNVQQSPGDIVEKNKSTDPNLTPIASELKRGLQKRTPSSKLNKVHSNFKSPGHVNKTCKLSLEEEVQDLEKKQMQLDSEIAQLDLEGYKMEELNQHIDMLHEYNDIKDIGQALLGRIAALRGTTTRDLYSHFGLDLED
ncbi:DNA repair protein SWI5 homolog [Stigmatopora nigra]